MADLPTTYFEQITPGLSHRDPLRAGGLAELIWIAAEDFYSGFPLDRASILGILAQQIAAPDSDLADTLVLRDSEDIALVGGTAVSSLRVAQMVTMALFLKQTTRDRRADLMTQMRRYLETTEPLQAPGHYISRVAVAVHRRGEGVGRRIVHEYLSRLRPQAVHLHVHRDNHTAIALYNSLGFVRHAGTKDFSYVALIRPA